MRSKYYYLLFLILLQNTYSAELQKDYLQSIQNASMHNRIIDNNLQVIPENNTITAVTYTGPDGYTPGNQNIKNETWITLEKELKPYCKSYVAKHKKITKQELDLWIRQLLGLPPQDGEERKFVIMNLKATQTYYGESSSDIGIFRPCTDPRIDKHPGDICPLYMDNSNNQITTLYKSWFINNAIYSYKSQNGYPWTGYGYTYNWNNKDNNSIVGLSEFVVRKNTPINVVTTNNSDIYIDPIDYCK